MPKKRRSPDAEAWRNAKTICRLNRRQVEMARALGMNPKKLPRLRPSPQQHWKLPVGAFIEECYRKRFGKLPEDDALAEPEPRSRQVRPADALAGEGAGDAMSQTQDLVCYLLNLADDLQKWLAHGSVTPEVLRQVGEELRDLAKALDSGAPISAVPEVSLPASPRGSRERTLDEDEEIPRHFFRDSEILSTDCTIVTTDSIESAKSSPSRRNARNAHKQADAMSAEERTQLLS